MVKFHKYILIYYKFIKNMGKSKKIAIENYQKFQSVAHWSHRSEKIKSAKKCCPLVSLLPIGHCCPLVSPTVYNQSKIIYK